jgi:hypothetical protein
MTTNMQRAISHRDVSCPPPGTRGDVWQSEGFHDYSALDYGAWMFQPDGEDVAYYMAEEDLEFIEE